MTRLIDDLLDVSRITSGKVRLELRPVEAESVTAHAVEAVRPLIEERRHRLTVDIERTSPPLTVRADPTRLEQVLVNLLTNAAKYTPESGSIALTVRREGADFVSFTVRDHGIGIAPEALPKMFELFAQGERSIARSEGGLGIGLTVVQKLTEMHGGSVSASSEGPGTGSEFTIRIPAATVGGATSRPVSGQDGNGNVVGAALTRRPARILVVDDNVDMARCLARLLEFLGHEVHMAYDGGAACEAAERLEPEFVLLDIGLPVLDGYKVAERLRAHDRCKDAVLIAISGYGQESDRRRARQAGFDHHLVKPVDHDDLINLLTRTLVS